MAEREFCACIFDMDGTLINSMEHWEQVFMVLLKRRGKEPDMETADALKARNVIEGLKFLKERYSLADGIEALYGELVELVRDIYDNLATVKSGVKDFLEDLKREGIPMCVATISDKGCAERVLKRLGIRDYFSFILTDADVGKGKSSPDLYLACAKRMGFEPKKTAVFEDSFKYALVAKSAGFLVYASEDYGNKNEFGEFLSFADGRAHWQK